MSLHPDYQNDFGPFEGRIWLNSASEGAMPKVAAEATQEAIAWKLRPYHLTQKRFSEVPWQMKKAIGELIHKPPEEVILANSTSYGIHLLANGFPFQTGDEILLMQNDFPTNILPWLALKQRGVIVRQLMPRGCVLQPEEIQGNITPATKLLCLVHVHTFTGHIVDLEKIGNICREKGIVFVVNLSQTLGTIPVNLDELPVDAVTSAGFKWLCGPYGTGFCWMRPKWLNQLKLNHVYWGRMLSAKALEDTGPLSLPEDQSARCYDVFGTANFFNFVPWRVAVEYLLGIGIERILEHNLQLVDQLIQGLDAKSYLLISPRERQKRSTLVVFSHPINEKNREIYERLRNQGIYLALWKGNLRAAPHIFNTEEDIDRLLAAL